MVLESMILAALVNRVKNMAYGILRLNLGGNWFVSEETYGKDRLSYSRLAK